VLEENDPIDDAAFSSSKVIALSSGGQLLRAWGTTVRVHAARVSGAAPLSCAFPPRVATRTAAAAPASPDAAARPANPRHQDGALLWEEATYSSASGAATTDAAEHAAKPVLLLGKIGERETVATLSRGRVQVRR
jgi:hypothetical protein